MSKSKITKDQRGATLCWHCGRHLTWAKGGTVKYATVVNPIGQEQRVHLDCAKKVVGDGVRLKQDIAGESGRSL